MLLLILITWEKLNHLYVMILLAIARKGRFWEMERDTWLSAAHILGINNVLED